jgi:hypothetical protein
VHTLSSISPKNDKAPCVFKALLDNTRWKRALHQNNLIREIYIDTLNACKPQQGTVIQPGNESMINIKLYSMTWQSSQDLLDRILTRRTAHLNCKLHLEDTVREYTDPNYHASHRLPSYRPLHSQCSWLPELQRKC